MQRLGDERASTELHASQITMQYSGCGMVLTHVSGQRDWGVGQGSLFVLMCGLTVISNLFLGYLGSNVAYFLVELQVI